MLLMKILPDGGLSKISWRPGGGCRGGDPRE